MKLSKEGNGRRVVTVAYGPDDTVAAAAYGVKDEDYFRWVPGLEDIETGDVVTLSLPSGLAGDIVTHGTSAQVYADGYTAAAALVDFFPDTQ